MMPLVAWVALGSALGGALRFMIARLLPTVPGGWPLATMAVNVAGCFAIGWLAAFFGARAGEVNVAETVRVFWLTGVLGGFTTYSAFALETLTLSADGALLRAVLYVIATVVLCLLAAWLGRALGPG